MARPTDPMIARLPEPVRKAVTEAVETATWSKVRRALSAFESCRPESRGPEITVQVLSTYSAEGIESALRLGLGCIPCWPRLEFAPLDTIDQQLFDVRSAVYRAGNLATVILWRVEELLPGLCHTFSGGGVAEQKRLCKKLQGRIRRLVQAYLERGTSVLFLSTLALPASSANQILDAQLDAGAGSTIAQINAMIFGMGSIDPRIKILDVNRWAAQEGAGYYDAQMDQLGRQPFTVRAAISLGLFLARNLRLLVAPRRKVLALDLDNTLWGGILGEDGVSQLKLGRDFPGNVFLRLQRELLELKHQGVLLMLASKNEAEDVRQSMLRMPDMLLKWDDFACHKINFKEKYLNLREAAAELGLGLDSFAFLDDSDFEREQMKAFNPEVLVLNERPDALHMLASLMHTDAFEAHQVSAEDRKRHEDYALRSARSQPQEGNVEGFLESLELRATIEPINEATLDRVAQMYGKTNQFNLTTRRHGLAELKRLASAPGAISLTLRLADKFGDQGIVGVLLAVPGEQAGSLMVDSFLISCRALGRGVEEVLWAELATRAANSGRERIFASYLPTAKNGLVSGLYDRFGLKRVSETPAGTDYLLEPAVPVAYPKWIRVELAAL